MLDDLVKFFNAQPLCTRYLALASFAIPLLIRLGVLSVDLLLLAPSAILWRFQLWRLFTAPFLTMPGLSFLFSVYFRYQYSYYLETEKFRGRTADYLWFLIISVGLLDLVGSMFGLMSTWDSFTMVIIYVWSQYNREVVVSLMFGIRLKAMYMPIALMVMDVLMGGHYLPPLLGIAVGHCYYYANEAYGHAHLGVGRFLKAPALLKGFMPVQVPASNLGFGTAIPSQAAGFSAATKPKESPVARPFAGRGRRLGE